LMRIQGSRRSLHGEDTGDSFGFEQNQTSARQRSGGLAGTGDCDFEFGKIVRAGMQFQKGVCRPIAKRLTISRLV